MVESLRALGVKGGLMRMITLDFDFSRLCFYIHLILLFFRQVSNGVRT
jgi:hypothetical protein